MERILKKLNINPDEDIYSIKEQLEYKQLEYLDKMNRLQYNPGDIERKEELEKQIKLDLQDIEEAIKTVSTTIRMISTGISLTKVGDKDKPKETEASIELEKLKANGGHGDSSSKIATETYTPNPEAEALCDEADRYLMGIGVEVNYDKAFDIYRLADQLGSLRGKAELGHMYLSGWGVAKDYEKAYELSEKAAKSGVACGQCNLGVIYEYGLGVPKDIDLAVKWYTKAADQGSARGLCNLGYLYERGRGVPEDVEKAEELYQKAVNQGYMSGHFNVPDMFEFRERKLKENGASLRNNGSLALNMELNLYKELEANLYFKEHMDMSLRWIFAYSTPNEFRYLRCYTRATENQESKLVLIPLEVVYHLLRKYPSEEFETIYAEDLAVRRLYEFYRAMFEKMDFLGIYRFFKRFHNISQCKEIFKKLSTNNSIEDFILLRRIAEEENDTIAYKYLGDCYYYRLGTEKNYKEAFRCYKRATAYDNQEEIVEMLKKVEEAITNEMIFQEAMRMLETSSFQNAITTLEGLADKGFAEAQFEIGKMYLNGYRLPNDKWRADTYLNKAMLNGHPEAKQYLEKL